MIEDDIFILKSLLTEKTKEVIETFNPLNPFGFLNQLIKHFPEFSTPVDTKLYTTYLNFVKQPMDLRKIQVTTFYFLLFYIAKFKCWILFKFREYFK